MPPRICLRSAESLRQSLTSPNSRNASLLDLRPLQLSKPAPKIYENTPQHRYLSNTSSLQFKNTIPLLKKKDKNNKSSSSDSSENSSSSSSSTAEENDPFDFSTLQTGIDKSLEKLKNDLGKLRTGGRFNPEVLEGLRVKLGKDAKESFRLGDLAQVLPKGGRSVVVLVGEKDHIKPILSTIQSSPTLSLQPVPDPQNPHALNIPIPPPTKESRDAALQAASKAGELASNGVRNARGAMQKKLRAMEVKKTVRPDDSKKAHKEMEKVVEKGNGEVKKLVEAARKGMEQA
ncbi:predicted protein [Sclerotinia sclerotiorum 1980 UF-70]|uniref:Ribosome recycling factor domain-containing protein n=2 Tax=Sclerotinia sclerotiorum (strain ATCC 18683 / 1980 / Ss-1) TaxID=665079 RepID=A7EK01_SCLS1|nr:ribosome recycling factor domain-containing protein [Sclerotinia sclerotiorum 1980 UF-70]APA10064.1 hypothetical protein sscle_05g048340 [Sclerotinia sclerotiorum 1980 UF-70]EDO03167.1 predicted protein [Sclerotinia sclerotiorum 1980 UF-70]